MMLRASSRFALFGLLLLLPGCSSSATDIFYEFMDFIRLRKNSNVVLVSNSTTVAVPESCGKTNQVVIETSFPAGRRLYCRDRSRLSPELSPGPICPGGVVLTEPEVPSEIQDCSEVTLCGVKPSAIVMEGSRSDGGVISRMTYEGLPWGCDAWTEFSFDPDFQSDATSEIKFHVQPSPCPFCPSQNVATCLACRDLDEDETVQSGQVIKTSCTGAACSACEVLHQPGQLVPHGEGKVYYRRSQASCGPKCNQESLLRICNDGLWQGDPSFQHPSCIDSFCGCTLPGDLITYDHGATVSRFKSAQPACGIECASQQLDIRCYDGDWRAPGSEEPIASSVLSQYPAPNCSKRVCHCIRPGREIVADGQSRDVFSKTQVACTETCDAFKGRVTCQSGALTATDPAFLQYGADRCEQDDCGCRLNLASGSLLVGDGGSTVLYAYARNSVEVPDACSNPQNRVTVSCSKKQLSAFDAARFRFTSCTNIPLSCTFRDGQGQSVVVASGSSLTVSKKALPACGEACQNKLITCQNSVFKHTVAGQLVPIDPVELADYKSGSRCTPRDCNCRVNGHIIPFGSTRDGFYRLSRSEDCDPNGCDNARAALTCSEQGLTSSRGDDANAYGSRSCEVIPCGCRVPWGGEVESGKTIRIYSIERSTCEEPTACQQSANFRSVTCDNSRLSNYDAATFRFPSCIPQVCSCRWGDVEVPFGQSLRVFKAQEAPLGGGCDSISAEAQCAPGGLWSGADPSVYPFTFCAEPSDDGEGGGTGGGTGNDEGPGAGIKRRLGLGDGGGGGGAAPCFDMPTCRTAGVEVSPTVFRKQSCILPWGGGEIDFYGSVAAFDRQCVTLPGKCSNHRIVRSCHFMRLTGDDAFRFPACEEKSVCP